MKDSPVRRFSEPDLPKIQTNDVGNAERFVLLYGDNFRWCHKWKRWLAWTSGVWMQDSTGGSKAFRRFIEMVRGILKDASKLTDDAELKKVMKWVAECHGKDKIESGLGVVKNLHPIPIDPELLDQHPLFLNLTNGTMELGTMIFREHRREDMLTQKIGFPYDPEAECPFWISFLQRVLDHDDELIKYAQRAIGYTLSGDTSGKAFFFLWGSGDNGKSIFVEALRVLLGDYAAGIEVESLMIKTEGHVQTYDIAKLRGARFVSTSETRKGSYLDSSRIKRLTGSDTVTVRAPYQEPYDIRPEFKIWMAGNYKPALDGADKAMFRRVHLIPFEVCIPKDQQIPEREMHARLKREMPGILAWALRGWQEYQAQGLNPPKTVVEAVEEYRLESDPFGAFLDESTTKDEFGEVGATELYACYSSWSKRMGEKVPQNRHKFGRAMREKGFQSKHKRDGDLYVGLILKEEQAASLNYWNKD